MKKNRTVGIIFLTIFAMAVFGGIMNGSFAALGGKNIWYYIGFFGGYGLLLAIGLWNFIGSSGKPGDGESCATDVMEASEEDVSGNEGEATLPDPAKNLPMNWYAFLTNFALLAGALISVFSGISNISSLFTSDSAGELMDFQRQLQNYNVFVGIYSLAQAGVQFYTRSRLKGFYKNGPLMVTVCYGMSILLPILSLIALYVIVPTDYLGYYSPATLIGNIIGSSVILVCNIIYFKKRESLFDK